MNAQQIGSLILLSLFSLQNTFADNIRNITCVLSGITTTWALYEYYQKNNIKKELEQNKIGNKETIEKLENKFNDYKNEATALKNDQDLLSDIAEFIKKVEFSYAQELDQFARVHETAPGEYLSCFVNRIEDRVKHDSISVKEITRSLNQDYNLALRYKNQLEVKSIEWHDKENRKSYFEQGNQLIPHLENLITFFQHVLATLEQQSDYINLAFIVAKDFATTYAQEIKMLQSDKARDAYA